MTNSLTRVFYKIEGGVTRQQLRLITVISNRQLSQISILTTAALSYPTIRTYTIISFGGREQKYDSLEHPPEVFFFLEQLTNGDVDVFPYSPCARKLFFLEASAGVKLSFL